MSKLSELVSKGVRLIVVDPDAEPAPKPGRRPRRSRARPQPRDIPRRGDRRPRAAAGRRALRRGRWQVEDFGGRLRGGRASSMPRPRLRRGQGRGDAAGQAARPLGREVQGHGRAGRPGSGAGGRAGRDPGRGAARQGPRRLRGGQGARAARAAREERGPRARRCARRWRRCCTKINAEIERLKAAAEGAEKAFAQLQIRKRREEERLHEVVAHFVEAPDEPHHRRRPAGSRRRTARARTQITVASARVGSDARWGSGGAHRIGSAVASPETKKTKWRVS